MRKRRTNHQEEAGGFLSNLSESLWMSRTQENNPKIHIYKFP